MKRLIATILLVAVIVSGIALPEKKASAKEASLSSKKITVTTKQSKTIKVKNTTKKITWKILSGKKYITLKENGKTATITGKKKGTAKVQATVGKTKLTCSVTVKNAKNDTTPEPEATNTPNEKDEQDVTALKELIAQQRERGAMVSEDINDVRDYTWENGKLTKIWWRGRDLSGDLDVPKLVNLTDLECNNNQLTSLDVSGCVNLTYLSCIGNQLASLDVTNNVNLTQLFCSANQLTSLNVTNNVNLTYLWCGDNQLTSLDVTKNVNLEDIRCDGNQLTSLDVTNNTKLEDLWCDSTVTVIGYNK